jgi:hypothetical protein
MSAVLTGEARRKRFTDRVQLERSLLRIINSARLNAPALSGMTDIAIRNWSDSAAKTLHSEDVDRIASILMEIGVRADLITDSSREVFDAGHTMVGPDSIGELTAMLTTAVTESRGASSTAQA